MLKVYLKHHSLKLCPSCRIWWVGSKTVLLTAWCKVTVFVHNFKENRRSVKMHCRCDENISVASSSMRRTSETCQKQVWCSQCFKQLAANLDISYFSVIDNMQIMSKYFGWGYEERKSEWWSGHEWFCFRKCILCLDLLIAVLFALQLMYPILNMLLTYHLYKWLNVFDLKSAIVIKNVPKHTLIANALLAHLVVEQGHHR